MILEKQTEANIVKEGDSQESIGMSLDMESAQVLMQMLSKNLYSDSIGSTIRECASNALDSHRRANVTDPIVVSLEIIGGQWEFSVEDFGIGLDDEDVKNIISKYGKSTKRDSANELGMMGLGFKAPLAYSSSFYFVCRKHGIERKYMMYEGEDTNTIDQLYEKPTTERNGVKVIVPIKSYDKHDFIEKIKEQLAYFQHVYFNVPNVSNSFTIVRSEHFQWSELCSDGKLHICLDDVYYPIDFSKIGVDNIYFPVGLRFSLTDSIFPTPNRESIRYTKEAKAIILEKIGKVADYYVQKFNEEMKETEDIMSVINWYNYDGKYININGRSINISPIAKFSKTSLREPKLKGTDVLSSKFIHNRSSMLTMEYENKFIIEKGKMRKTERSWYKTVGYKQVLDDDRIYYVYSDRVSGNMRDYLKDLHKGKTVHLIKKSYQIPLKNGLSQESYYYMLDLGKHPKSDWRTIIKEWQHIVSFITNRFKNLDELEIPEQWIKSRKKSKTVISSDGTVKTRKIKLQGEVIGKEAQPLERYVDGQNCKFVSTTYKLQEMHKMKTLYVYGNESYRSLMDTFFKAFNKTVKFVLMSEREINVMQKVKIHNWITMEEFVKGENKPFRRIATAFLIEELMDNNKYAFNTNCNLLEQVSSDLYNKIIFLNSYEDKHNQWSSDEVKKAVLGIAKPNKLFDMEVYPIYKEVEKVLEELPFINTVCGTNTYNNRDTEKWVVVMRDLFRFHKRRMNWNQYKITLNEDVVTPMTEEIIQES